MNERSFVIGVVLAACSVYEPSLLSGGSKARTGGMNSGDGGDPAGGDGEAGEGTSPGGVSSGGGIATGGTLGGDAGSESGGRPVDTGGAGPARGGVSNAGATSGGVSNAGAASGGVLTGGGPNAGASSGGAANGGAANGGASKGGSAGVGAAGSGGTAGGAKGGAGGVGGVGGAGGTTPSTGGQSTGGAATGGSTGILFSDDFETSNASAWAPSTTGDWSVASDGSFVYRQGTVVNTLRVASAGSAAWQNQSVQARVKVLAFGGTTVSSSYFAAIYARYTDGDNHYYLALRSDGKISIRRKIAGSNASIGSAITPGALIATGTWYTVKLEIVGTTLSSSVDGVLYESVTDTSFASGKAGVGSTNASVVFDDVVVRLP